MKSYTIPDIIGEFLLAFTPAISFTEPQNRCAYVYLCCCFLKSLIEEAYFYRNVYSRHEIKTLRCLSVVLHSLFCFIGCWLCLLT